MNDGNKNHVPLCRTNQISKLINNPTNTDSTPAAKTGALNNDEFFEGMLKTDLDRFFDVAPERAQVIVARLKNPQLLNRGTARSAFFLGEPGSGKTTMAKAIAYKLSQGKNNSTEKEEVDKKWRYHFLTSTDIKGEHRDQKAAFINVLFADAERNLPMILIIDEIHQLLEHADSENYDTDATSKALWSNIDRQANKDNFFFIGLMNNDDKLPKPFQSRIRLRAIEFKPITDLSYRRNELRRKIVDDTTELLVDDNYLDQLLRANPNVTFRDFDEIALFAAEASLIDVYKFNKDSKTLIKKVTQKHLESAFNENIKGMTRQNYNRPEITDEERRHQESLKKQDELFVRSQMIALATGWKRDKCAEHESQDFSSRSFSKISEKDLAGITGSFSNEQKKINFDNND